MSIASLLTTTDLATAIRAGIRGDVVTPDDPSFAAAAFGFDPATEHRPELVVIAQVAADVAATVGLAARAGRRVAVQTFGFTTAASGPDTILVVTRLLASVSIDPEARTATVGAGAGWRQVLDSTSSFGLAPVSGPAAGSGAVRRVAAGKFGPAARAFSFAGEFVREFEVVTMLGDLVRVNADQRPELFAALRAGRSASVVVTAITIDLVPAGSLFAGGLWFSVDDVREVLTRWQEWVGQLPESTSTSVALMDLPAVRDLPQQLRGRSVVHVRFNHVGDADQGAQLLSAIREVATPLLDTVRVPVSRGTVIDAAAAASCSEAA